MECTDDAGSSSPSAAHSVLEGQEEREEALIDQQLPLELCVTTTFAHPRTLSLAPRASPARQPRRNYQPPLPRVHGTRTVRHADRRLGSPSPSPSPAHSQSNPPTHSPTTRSCVSRGWNALGREDFLLWKRVCSRIFAEEPPATLEDAYMMQLYGSWRNMFLQRPRVRLDGVYVSRNTYVRTGISEWRREKPVHLCVYYRYLRFIKGGKFVCRTSPYPLKQVVKSLTESKSIKSTGGRHQHQHETQHVGRYRFVPQSGVVQTAFRYQNSFGTEVRSKLRLRGTTPGAFNRLDIENIVTWDRDRDVSLPMLRLDEEENDILGERRDHKTSDTAYVFVPFEQVSAQFTSRHSTPRRHDATTPRHSPTLSHPPTLHSPAGQHPRAEPRRRQARLFRRRLTNPNTLRYCILVYYIQNGASDIHSHQTSIKTSSCLTVGRPCRWPSSWPRRRYDYVRHSPPRRYRRHCTSRTSSRCSRSPSC